MTRESVWNIISISSLMGVKSLLFWYVSGYLINKGLFVIQFLRVNFGSDTYIWRKVK